MARYAVDVVILPPEPVVDLCIAWNRQLTTLESQSIVLNTTDTLPHISLLMGCMTDAFLRKAAGILEQITCDRSSIPLNITGLQSTEGSHPVAALDIALSDELAEFQNTVIEAFRPVITQDAEEVDLFDPPPISASALEWINHFIPEQCYERFWPHITLGHGNPAGTQEPLVFRATRIAICHLGNHCTCRKILAEAQLMG